MKKCFILFSMVMLMSLGLSAQTMIAAWTFDTLQAAPNTPQLIPANNDLGEMPATANIYLDGTNGSSLFSPTPKTKPQINAFAGDTAGDPRDSKFKGMALTLANTSSNGNNMVIKFSTKDFAKIKMNFVTRGTKKGFTTHKWAYSTDGTNFTNFDVDNTANTTSTFQKKEFLLLL